ncbi:MAG TPA: hypothetical protein VIM58_07640 [Candidatus Methylacidiphilales bacterium]
MKTPASEIRQLLVLTTFVVQKALVSAGRIVFAKEGACSEVADRADQIARLRAELDRMIEARLQGDALSLSDTDDAASLRLFQALAAALEETARRALAAAYLSLTVPEDAFGGRAARNLFRAWSQGSDLLTAALAVLMEPAPLDPSKVVRKLGEERFRMGAPLRDGAVVAAGGELASVVLKVLEGFDGAVALVSAHFERSGQGVPAPSSGLRN